MDFATPQIAFKPVAGKGSIVIEGSARFSVLTSRLIRMEYSPSGIFEDRPSQAFWYREQPVPSFSSTHQDGWLIIETGDLFLRYKQSDLGFTRDTLQIEVRATKSKWHYGDKNYQNLKGTGRTLDGWDGPIELEEGLLSRAGWSVVNDSHSLIFDQNCWLETRSLEAEEYNTDLYFFGYGHDYTGCLRDYFKVSGSVPMVPRYILGNWWSRYWAYTQQELGNLMLEFKERQVPLSVCIIDMDWHVTKTGNESSGWTGYTWNRDLFPDPEKFLQWLHADMGLKTGINLHPADGVWPHEEMYQQMAKKMGMDSSTNSPVYFDIADPKFAQNYFDVLHHPYEKMGVDFWWIDWQQGARITHSKHPLARKLDPLWWLNHLHYFDLGRGGKNRSFIFSRWGGLGNHRYPIGFSGDSVVSWKSLEFQPTFTSTAANVGFGWWSHDIGGHMFGIEEGELYTRWVQFGVFSPVLRLHCTNNPYQDRAPWVFGEDVFKVARAAMQLRHALIPYLYTGAWRFAQGGLPLCTPMYYQNPESPEAYECPNQYMFGEALLAAPFVSPKDADTLMAKTNVWLPEGEWFDFFDGERFTGGKWITIYGDLTKIPVFAKAGSVVPMAQKSSQNGTPIPTTLELNIYPGADGEYILYEDAGNTGEYLDGKYSITKISQQWKGSKLIITVQPSDGDLRHLPNQREIVLKLFAITNISSVSTTVDGKVIQNKLKQEHNFSVVSPVYITPLEKLEVIVSTESGSLESTTERQAKKMRDMLRTFRLAVRFKAIIDNDLMQIIKDPNRLRKYQGDLSESQFTALLSIVTQ